MRDEDRFEIYATRHDHRCKPECVAAEAVASKHGAIFGKGEPICAVGAAELWPGFFSVWMFATPKFKRVAKEATAYVIRELRPTILPHAKRVECRSIEHHVTAHKWLEFLGAERESVLHKYGKGGEAFFVFTWNKWIEKNVLL